jgi:5'-phosphate synthase pdxT subunit
VNRASHLDQADALIIPGGESSTMLKLIAYEDLFEPLKRFGQVKPVFGTCAGAILLAREVTSPKQVSFGLLDISVERNAYGRQRDSHVAALQSTAAGDVEAVFIRAPIIRSTGAEVRVLATHRGDPVWVEQGRHMAATFHPELTLDARIHARFLKQVAS